MDCEKINFYEKIQLVKQAEIYIITNIGDNINKGKQYIGKAVKYTGEQQNLWGTEGRWKSHISQTKNNDYRCRLLHKDIEKFGKDCFKVEKIYDCLKINMDDLEKFNILKFNTLSPNGYNINEGGNDGKNYLSFINSGNNLIELENKNLDKSADDTNAIQIEDYSKKHIKSIKHKNRKYDEDKNLPKYISAIRQNMIIDNKDILVITGYRVEKVPTNDNSGSKYHNQKTFSNKDNHILALDEAKLYLSSLLNDNSNSNQSNNEINNEIFSETKTNLTDYIKKIYNNEIFTGGYKVVGLVDNENNKIPDRYFINNCTKNNLEQAEKYIKEVNYIKENNITLLDNNWLIVEPTKPNKLRHKDFYLPNYINPIYNKHTKLIQGFTVQGIPMLDKDKKPILDENGKKKNVSEKKFTKQGIKKGIVTITPEMNYIEAIKYLIKTKKDNFII